MRNMGKIPVHDAALLEWLQFEGGRVLGVRRSQERSLTTEVILEHPDLPNTDEGELICVIPPVYLRRDTERLDPPTTFKGKVLRTVYWLQKIWKN